MKDYCKLFAKCSILYCNVCRDVEYTWNSKHIQNIQIEYFVFVAGLPGHGYVCIYGWKVPGLESLLGECQQNVWTLGVLTQSFFNEIARDFLRLVRNWYSTDNIK